MWEATASSKYLNFCITRQTRRDKFSRIVRRCPLFQCPSQLPVLATSTTQPTSHFNHSSDVNPRRELILGFRRFIAMRRTSSEDYCVYTEYCAMYCVECSCVRYVTMHSDRYCLLRSFVSFIFKTKRLPKFRFNSCKNVILFTYLLAYL